MVKGFMESFGPYYYLILKNSIRLGVGLQIIKMKIRDNINRHKWKI